MQIEEFKGTITNPDVKKDVNNFLKRIPSSQIVSIQYNTNVVQVRKKEADAPTALTISSVLIAYEED